ncbi:hypothetical protein T492DRAFT_859275 [Pavlovales sp. CCMP2436]|nr:hypothetical protein T492DRAFT_859275 [Pavlovales sp. CCMP2436]
MVIMAAVIGSVTGLSALAEGGYTSFSSTETSAPVAVPAKSTLFSKLTDSRPPPAEPTIKAAPADKPKWRV